METVDMDSTNFDLTVLGEDRAGQRNAKIPIYHKELPSAKSKIGESRVSLVVQWLRIRLPVQGTRI